MNVKRNRKRTAHSGSTLDCFQEEEGIREEVEAVAIKRVLAWQIKQALQEQKKTKQTMPTQLHAPQSRRAS
jgi:antitoxin HicB